jgi:hypothetical protein
MATITIPKLKEYQRFHGDNDTMARTQVYTPLNSTEEWFLISRLIGDIIVVKKGLASDEFGEKMRQELAKHCVNQAVIAELKEMAA